MKLFLGLIFVLLDLEIPVGTAAVGLLPDFVGYFLMMKALAEQDDPWRHGAFGLGLVSLVVYVAGLVAKGTGAQVGIGCVELLTGIWMLVLVHRIAGDRKSTKELFPVVACMQMLTMLLGWLPLVGTVCAAANAVVAICFLAAYYKSMDRR